MQNILDHVQCGIFVLSIEANTQVSDLNDQGFILRFSLANSAFVHLVFGERSIDQTVDLVGLQPKECLSLGFAELLNKYVRQCLQTRQVVVFEEQLDLVTNRMLSISLSLDIDSINNSEQIVGTCQDITDRSLSKFQVQDLNQKKFSHLVSEVSDAFVVVDHDGVVRYVNQSAENLFGCKSEDIIGETFGLPVVAGESTDVDILNRGSTTSA